MTETLTRSGNTIRKTVFLAAPKEKVWTLLTKADGLARWFHPADADLAEGQAFVLRSAKDGDRMCWGRVTRMAPHHALDWDFTVGPLNGVMTHVSWRLDDADGGTRLSLTHAGLPNGGEGFGLVLALDKGWHGFLGQLQQTQP